MFGAFELADKRSRDSVRSGGELERWGPQVDTIWIRDVHPSVDIQQGYLFTINRDLDLFRAFGRMECSAATTKQLSGCLMMKRDSNNVVGVGKKGVNN